MTVLSTFFVLLSFVLTFSQPRSPLSCFSCYQAGVTHHWTVSYIRLCRTTSISLWTAAAVW